MHTGDLDRATVGQVLSARAEFAAEQPWLLWDGIAITFGQAEQMVRRHARAFASLGVGAGDHIAIMLPNSPTYLYVLWGLARLGATAILINTAAKGDMLRYLLRQSDACRIVVDASRLLDAATAARDAPGVYQLVRVADPSQPSDGTGTLGRLSIVDLDQVLASVDHEPIPDRSRSNSPHVIMYTSGTTGPSKGVLSSHQHALSAARHGAGAFGYRDDDVLFTCLPLFHVNALYYTAYIGLVSGIPFALKARFSARSFWDDVRAAGVTAFNTLGAMTTILWNRPPSPGDRRHRVRQCLMVPVSSELYHGFRSRFGIQVVTAFAMTENFVSTVFTPGDPPTKVGSVGRTVDCADVAVLGPDGAAVAAGTVGEICVRPRHEGLMMSGYYNMPEATAKAWQGGWFHTGDRGYLDQDNYLFFVDRSKDSIRRRGENISSYEVEHLAMKHPDVLEAAAVAVASEIGEEEVLLYVVLAPGSHTTYESLSDFCQEHMPSYMAPRFFLFVNELPKTETQKIEKHKLRQKAQRQASLLWDRDLASRSNRKSLGRAVNPQASLLPAIEQPISSPPPTGRDAPASPAAPHIKNR